MNMWLTKILQNLKSFNAKHTLFFCGLLSALLYIYLAQVSQRFGQADFLNLFVVVVPCAILSFIPWYHFHISHGDNFLISEQPIMYIIGFAVLFRFIGFFIFPILEDDFYRYLWDGYILVEQGSPYLNAPSAYFGFDNVPDNFQKILDNINYPDIATVYGPVCQWIFGLAYIIAPGELWPLKLLVLLADLILLLIIVLLMRIHSVKPYYLLLYAWCPLIVIQFVVSVHPDIISVMFIFIALFAKQRGNYFLMAASLALAVATKVFAIIIVPILLGFYWKRWLVFLLVAIAVAWPLGLVDAWLPEGLKAMATQWYFNAPLYFVFSKFEFTTVKLGFLTIFCVIYVIGWKHSWWQAKNKFLRGDILFALFLLILPALNTWYLIFVLPFGVFYASRTLWAASILIFLSYIFIQNEELINSGWILAAEFSILLLIFLVELKFGIKNLKAA